MANTIGEKELKTSWPITEGLTAGTTKTSGKEIFMEIEEQSFVSSNDRKIL